MLLLKSDTVPNAAVIVTSIADSDGNPVVVALHLSRNEGFGVVTRVASLYGRKNSRNFIADQLLRGNLIGYSKKEADRLLHRDGLQLPRRNTAVDFGAVNVSQDADVVNTYSMENMKKFAFPKVRQKDAPHPRTSFSPPQGEGSVKGEPFAGSPIAFNQGSGHRICKESVFPKVHQIKKTPAGVFFIWWTRRDSNPRPPRCERGALPTEPRAHIAVLLKLLTYNSTIARRCQDESVR